MITPPTIASGPNRSITLPKPASRAFRGGGKLPLCRFWCCSCCWFCCCPLPLWLLLLLLYCLLLVGARVRYKDIIEGRKLAMEAHINNQQMRSCWNFGHFLHLVDDITHKHSCIFLQLGLFGGDCGAVGWHRRHRHDWFSHYSSHIYYLHRTLALNCC